MNFIKRFDCGTISFRHPHLPNHPLHISRKEQGTIVLTFDDSVASHATFVAPLLKKYSSMPLSSLPKDLISPMIRKII